MAIHCSETALIVLRHSSNFLFICALMYTLKTIKTAPWTTIMIIIITVLICFALISEGH